VLRIFQNLVDNLHRLTSVKLVEITCSKSHSVNDMGMRLVLKEANGVELIDELVNILVLDLSLYFLDFAGKYLLIWGCNLIYIRAGARPEFLLDYESVVEHFKFCFQCFVF